MVAFEWMNFMSQISCPMGLKCEELPCPNHSSCQLWTLPLPIPFLRNSDCLVVEPVSLLLKEYALEHQINQDSYFQYFFTNLIKNSYLEAGWLAAEPLPYQKNDQSLVVCFNCSEFAIAVEIDAMKGREGKLGNLCLWLGFFGSPLYKYGYCWLNSESTFHELFLSQTFHRS